ncbi:MAG: flagellar hook-basal body complex protein [Planctomycetes bacterium]|nr:flagellar hook-basal body complex protein [Planctomycetota bacterium]
MALIRALNTAVSGIKNNQLKLDVIGDNLANATTTGFKGSRVDFKTLLSQTLTFGSQPQGLLGGINPIQTGLGATLASTTRDHAQGELELTGRNTDMAIEGNGFFILQDHTGRQLFTRDGSFALNSQNKLIEPSTGMIIQGVNANLSTFVVASSTSLENVNIPIGDLQIAKASTTGLFNGNLNGGGEQALQGTILESSPLVDVTTSTAATSSTLLTNLGRLPAGSTTPIDLVMDSGDIIFVNPKKGGRALPQKRFIVSSAPVQGFDGFGTTLGQFSSFLDRALGINKGGTELMYSAIKDDDNDSNTPGVTGAATSLITAGGAVTGVVASGVDLSGVAAGDVIRFNTGTGAGQLAAIATVSNVTKTITFTSALPTTIPQPIVGDQFSIHETPGVKIGTAPSASGVLRIAGNVGAINDITDLQITTSDGNQVSAFFTRQSAAGESAFANATFFDSLGTAHIAELSFVLETRAGTDSATKSVGNTFRFFAESEDNLFLSSGQVQGKDRVVGTGTVTFSLDGQFLSGNPLATLKFNLNNQGVTTPLIVTPDFTGLTGFANETSEVFLETQDGFAKGVLNDFAVEADGTVRGIFSNGQTRSLAKLMLARFSNQEGLEQIGHNLFSVSSNSGDPIIGSAGTLGIGLVRGGVLEASNVDLARQFTDMIIAQRSFQANARTITVSNTLLEDLLRLV